MINYVFFNNQIVYGAKMQTVAAIARNGRIVNNLVAADIEVCRIGPAYAGSSPTADCLSKISKPAILDQIPMIEVAILISGNIIVDSNDSVGPVIRIATRNIEINSHDGQIVSGIDAEAVAESIKGVSCTRPHREVE